jgi:hypothetical protein
MKVLSIDGGGIRGLIPALVLAEIERRTGRRTAEMFDLIAGTSTGGIIAMGLALGLTAGELLQIYKEDGPAIFPSRRVTSNLRRILRAKYSLDPLRHALTKVFGDRRIGHCRKRLLVPSLDLAAERVYIYKTAHHPSLIRDYNVPAIEVGLATVAAPTYFPIHLSEEGAYIDGSLWARNPLALAVVEAIGVLNWPREDMRVLSLGCTSHHLEIAYEKRLSFGASYWGGRIADVFMKAQSSSAIAMAHTLIGSHSVFRISPDTTAQGFTMDGVRHIPELEALGRDEAHRAIDDLGEIFFAAPAAPFTPCHILDAEQPPVPPPASLSTAAA